MSLKLRELKKKTPQELLKYAEETGVENASSMRTQDMLFEILRSDIEVNARLRIVLSFIFLSSSVSLNFFICDRQSSLLLSLFRVFPSSSSRTMFNGFNDATSSENFDTLKPKSIYGFTKFASELLIEEFSYAFDLKFIINRCGVISGPLQFGKQDQGFVSLWVIHHIMKKKLSYIGYGGHGNQVRDVLHIDDLCELIHKQIKIINKIYNKLYTVGGSKISYTSLKNLTKICQNITGNKISIDKKRSTSIYDIPYFITDNRKVSKAYKWRPKKNINKIVYDITTWINNNKNLIQKYF